ncbi:MAG: hypothetical protein OXC44_02810, partial [Proteobacteria bacterium]|nr:hypothetical protein [Pseudomonadota bacterium]
MMILRLVTTFILLCSLVVVPHFNSIAFGKNDSQMKVFRGSMPPLSPSHLSDIPSQEEVVVNEEQRKASNNIHREEIILNEKSEKFKQIFREPTIDMVWFIGNGVTNTSNTMAAGFKQHINKVVEGLSPHVSLRLGVFSSNLAVKSRRTGTEVLFSSSDISKLKNTLRDEKGGDFKLFTVPDSSGWGSRGTTDRLLLEFAYSWLRYSLDENNYERSNFFRYDPKDSQTGGIYKRIFVFVTSGDSRRFNGLQLEAYARQKGKVFWSNGIYHRFNHSMRSPSPKLNMADEDFFHHWIFDDVLAVSDVRNKFAYEYGVFQDLDDNDVIKDDKKKKIEYLTNHKHVLDSDSYRDRSRDSYPEFSNGVHMKHNDFIDALIGKKADYEKEEERVWKALFPAENNAEKAEYLSVFNAFEENKIAKTHIEKTDIWAFVYDGSSHSEYDSIEDAGKELVSCISTPPPPPTKFFFWQKIFFFFKKNKKDFFFIFLKFFFFLCIFLNI